MTTTELTSLAHKVLTPDEFVRYAAAIKCKKFSAARMIAESCLDNAKDALIENAIKEYCDPVVTSHYKISNDLMNETLEFIIINSEVVK